MFGGRSPKPVPPRLKKSACAHEQGQGAGHVSASLTGFLTDSRQIVGVSDYVSTAGMRRFSVTAAQPRVESPGMRLISAMVGQWQENRGVNRCRPDYVARVITSLGQCCVRFISTRLVFGYCALSLVVPLRGQEDAPAVTSLGAKLQEKTTYLNPDFLLFSVDAK